MDSLAAPTIKEREFHIGNIPKEPLLLGVRPELLGRCEDADREPEQGRAR